MAKKAKQPSTLRRFFEGLRGNDDISFHAMQAIAREKWPDLFLVSAEKPSAFRPRAIERWKAETGLRWPCSPDGWKRVANRISMPYPEKITEAWLVGELVPCLVDRWDRVIVKAENERDRYIYREAFRGTAWKAIVAEVNRHPEWQALESEQAAILAANRYADKHGLDRPPKRRRGRKSNM